MTLWHSDAAGDLHLGDCADVLPRLNVSPALILTSPPYDALRDYGGYGFGFARVAEAIVGVMPDGGYLVWVVSDATKDGSETGTSYRQVLGFMERGLKLHDTMIYQRALPRYIKGEPRYANTFEFMFVFVKGLSRVFHPICDSPNVYAGKTVKRSAQMREEDGSRTTTNTHYGEPMKVATHSKRSNIWRYATGHGQSAPDMPSAHEHPAIFPLALARDHIRSWTNPGDLVLDPMAGSGTTLRAAKDLGRRFVGVEIHQPYWDLARKRLAQEVMEL